LAIQLSESNTAALMNKILIEWQQGMLRDDEVLQQIKTKVKAQDPKAAELMFILFRKNIAGGYYT